MKTLEEFEFLRAPHIPTALIRNLAEGGYLNRSEPIIFLGDTGIEGEGGGLPDVLPRADKSSSKHPKPLGSMGSRDPKPAGAVPGRHFEDVIIVLCVRWYFRYSLSYRDLEEMMADRGLSLDHVTI